MLKNLPKPDTFEQGERLKFGLFMVGGGMFCSAFAVAMTVFFAWLAFKLPLHQAAIIWILAGSLAGAIVGMLIVLISMAVGGPVRRGFSASVTKEGVSLSANGGDEPSRQSENDGSGAVS